MIHSFIQDLLNMGEPGRQTPAFQEASALGGDVRIEKYTKSHKKVSDGNRCSEKGNWVIRW